MKIINLALTAAALSAVSPAIAHDEAISFKHDGVSYTYTVKQLSEKTKVISGQATPGSAFRLVVSGNRVSGTTDGMPVAFLVSEARGASGQSGSVTVASR